MTSADPAFVADMEAAARAAQAEEIRFRKSIAEEIEARERARAYAFRRLGLMRTLIKAARGTDAPQAARAAQLQALAAELGWPPPGDDPPAALKAFEPVADAVWLALVPPPSGAQAEAPPLPAPAEALAAYEAWYRTAFGRPFLAILDQEPLEIPVVEG